MIRERLASFCAGAAVGIGFATLIVWINGDRLPILRIERTKPLVRRAPCGRNCAIVATAQTASGRPCHDYPSLFCPHVDDDVRIHRRIPGSGALDVHS